MEAKIKKTDIVKPLSFHVNQESSIDNLARMSRNQIQFDFDVYLKSYNINLQRPLCWTLAQKQELIKSIIIGRYIPSIVVVKHTNEETRDSVYKVIDGKQRLSAMLDFIEEKFPLTINGQDYFINDLSEDLSGEIKRFWPKFTTAFSYESTPITDDELIEWFKQLNFGGTPQDEEHMKILQSFSK